MFNKKYDEINSKLRKAQEKIEYISEDYYALWTSLTEAQDKGIINSEQYMEIIRLYWSKTKVEGM